MVINISSLLILGTFQLVYNKIGLRGTYMACLKEQNFSFKMSIKLSPNIDWSDNHLLCTLSHNSLQFNFKMLDNAI